MRSKTDFENERYFGLQKFNRASDAFKVMVGKWNEFESDDELYILQDEEFKKVILNKALDVCINYKLDFYTKDAYESWLCLGENKSQYLLNFDFFLQSKVGKCYYTCRMKFKDDAVDEWNKRQWGYYEELFDLYDIANIVKEAQYVVDEYFKESEKDPYFIMLKNGDDVARENLYYDIYKDITSVVHDEETNQTYLQAKIGKDVYF